MRLSWRSLEGRLRCRWFGHPIWSCECGLGGGGGGPARTVQTTTPTAPEIPSELRPLISASVQQAIDAQKLAPLTTFLGPHVQAIPQASPEELALIGQLQGMAGTPLTPAQETALTGTADLFNQPLTAPEELAADLWRRITGAPLTPAQEAARGGFEAFAEAPLMPAQVAAGMGTVNLAEEPLSLPQRLAQMGFGAEAAAPLTGPQAAALRESNLFLGTPLGESPATVAGMEAWRRLVEPTIRSAHALQGNLGGGGFTEDIALSAGQTAFPLIQEELRQRAALIPELARLGGEVFGQETTALSGLERVGGTEVSQEQQALRDLAGLGRTGFEQATTALDALARLGGTEFAQETRALEEGAGLGARATAVQQDALRALTELGGTEFQQIMGATGQALQAAGGPRELTQEQLQAVIEDFRRQQGLTEATTLGPLGAILPSAAVSGQAVTTRQRGGGGMLGK